MATFKFKNINGVARATVKKLERIVNNKTFLERVAQFTLEQVVGDLREGKDPTTSKRRTKKLSNAGKKNRSKVIKNGNPKAEWFSRTVPNTTITGEFLDSIVAKLKGRRIQLEPRGVHLKYKTKKNKTRTPGIKNAKLASILDGLGYTIFGISPKLEKALTKLASEEIRRNL